MFINMVPDHDLFEMQPKSGGLQGTHVPARKEIPDRARNHAQNNRNRTPRGEIRLSLWRKQSFYGSDASLSSSSRRARNSRTSLGASKWPATPLALRPTEKATPSKSGMIANTDSSVTSSPMKNGLRPLNGGCVINSRTPLALVKPECLISQTCLPGSTSIGASGRSARISDTAA